VILGADFPVLTMSISVQNSVMVRPDEASKAISKWMNGIEQVHTYTNTYIITLLTNGGETEGCPTDGAISVPEQALNIRSFLQCPHFPSQDT
jgi:hypothetical protein